MRWIWLDRILELQPRTRCVAVRAVTLGEDVLHDHFPAEPRDVLGVARPKPPVRRPLPCMPRTLIIEGMAQTAGILVGHAGAFKEKVILAKIGRATFTEALAVPGTTLRHTATVDRLDESGASTVGTVELLHPDGRPPEPVADIELMFSHVDRNRQGLSFPEGNFVFTGQLYDLLVRSGVSVPPEEFTAPRTAR